MFFLSTISQLVCAWFAFLLPCYATWKSLQHRPLSEPEVEKWAKYWTVMGLLLAIEHAAEWFVSWFPFYWEIKTLFILYLCLPSLQGSSYVYEAYLAPYFTKNEAALDSKIESTQNNAMASLQSGVAKVWETVYGLLTKGQKPDGAAPNGTQQSSAPGAPKMQDLWNQYGPSVIGMVNRFVKPAANGAAAQDSGATSSYNARPSLNGHASGSSLMPEAKVPLPQTPEPQGFM